MTINISIEDIGKTASFSIYPSAIIRDGFKDVRIEAVATADTATKYNLAELHANVYGTLPEGVPNDYRSYKYLIVRFPSGETMAIGLPWIIDSSFELYSTTNINIEVRGKGVENVDELRRILAARGYTDVSFTTTSAV